MTDRPDLDAITARAAAATPGPWGTTTTWRDELVVTRPGGGEIATLGDPDDTQVHADAAFISHARADVDTLLDEVRRLEAELADAEYCAQRELTQILRLRELRKQASDYITELKGELKAARREGAAQMRERAAAVAEAYPDADLGPYIRALPLEGS